MPLEQPAPLPRVRPGSVFVDAPVVWRRSRLPYPHFIVADRSGPTASGPTAAWQQA